MSETAESLIARLGLRPHPEGGHFVETYRHTSPEGGRGVVTAIYYLLGAGEESRWHRLTDAVEIWTWHAGAPLALTLCADGRHIAHHRLGPTIADGQQPQAVVPIGCWQTAKSQGEWTLVGCIVAPAFEFSGFEMSPPGWTPG